MCSCHNPFFVNDHATTIRTISDVIRIHVYVHFNTTHYFVRFETRSLVLMIIVFFILMTFDEMITVFSSNFSRIFMKCEIAIFIKTFFIVCVCLFWWYTWWNNNVYIFRIYVYLLYRKYPYTGV